MARKSADIPATVIERFPPFGNLGQRKVITLPLEQVRPVIHLAHHQSALPTPPERIIVDHEFILTFGGGGRLKLGAQEIDYGPNELLHCPPFVPHRFTCDPKQRGEHIVVHFDWSPKAPRAVDTRARQPYEVRVAGDLRIPARMPLSPGHRVEKEFRSLVEGWTSGQPLGRFQAFAALTNMIAWALERASRSSAQTSDAAAERNRARVDRAIEHARSRLAHALSAEELADVAGVSASRLTSLFRAATGYAPMEYVRRLRVDEAKRLLADMDLSVKEVAFRTGFADIYHFSHAFQRVVGLSATQYRHILLSAR